MKKILFALVLSTALAGCTLTKTENPLAPSVAGPIPGVNITAPNPLSPRDGFRVFNDQQPITLSLNNAQTSGVRPLYYLFEVASDAGFASTVFTLDKVPPGEGGRTTFRLTQNLASGRTYYWRSKAHDGANEGPYSPHASFEVVTPANFQPPVPRAPAHLGMASSSLPTFTWNNAERTGTPNGPVLYDIEISPRSTFVPALLVTVGEAAGAQTSAVPMTESLPSTVYYWRIRVKDSITTSEWAPLQNFTTPGAGGGGGSGSGGGSGGGSGSGSGGGQVGNACHVGPGPLTASRASDIVYGCGSEFPGLLAVFSSEEQAVAAAEQLLLRTIWHLKLAGFQAARQRNPSGLISNDKLNIFIDGAYHVYDIYTLGFAGTATKIAGLNDVCPDLLCSQPVPENGIPD
jgi:hypothetical protein